MRVFVGCGELLQLSSDTCSNRCSNSTSFNLKQEVFIRRDEEKDLKRVIYIGEIILTLVDQRT